jgi:hypothetical protein
MFKNACAILFGMALLGIAPAIACSPSRQAFENRPKLEEILASHPIVFIGTVVDAGGQEKVIVGSPPREIIVPPNLAQGRTIIPMAKRVTAKIKVEIPIRGEVVDIFEVPNGGGGDCSNGFEVGQRWFFSGTSSGSHFFDGSTVLVDQFGNVRATEALGVDHTEIVTMFPELLKLPPPSLVVQNYLKEK